MNNWVLVGGLIVSLFIAIVFWIPGFLQSKLADYPAAMARLFGMAGYTLAIFKVGLGSRLPLFEKGLSIKKIETAHRLTAVFGFSFIFAHPVSYFTSDLLNYGRMILEWPMLFGLIVLILILVTVLSVILFKDYRKKYGSWKGMHWISYLIPPIIFIHSMLLGSDINSQVLLKIYWILLGCVYLILVASIYLHRRRSQRVENAFGA